eukprot:TRINITY_DN78865_c0_g1_i1.p1 TRINITY_DN78865_c0_g1~~TRINITY_DN78865_c0_g1_i1.p1  ORF type:complete len:452 (+),score=44.01 TRINITY_DN78865_c0_g1_i1:66-1421(+)
MSTAPREAEPLMGEKAGDGSGGCNLGAISGVICCCLAVILWGVVPFVFGFFIGFDQFLLLDSSPSGVHEYIFVEPPLSPATIPEYIFWPGCTEIGFGSKNKTYLAECAPPCYSPKLIPAIQAFNTNNGVGKLVTYKSRKDLNGETVTLTGWWLPGDKTNLPNGTLAPRIVYTHGFTSNSNKFPATISAYYLRSLGFDVLINNLRDHGYSSNTSLGITTWGYVYHYDVLGAWDYLLQDPDGIFGGSLPASQVGIMGGSMGAFVSINAFTLEKDVPAAFCDAPPGRPQDVFFFGASQSDIPGAPQLVQVPGVGQLIWFWMVTRAGVDIEAREPLTDIPSGPLGKRPIALVANKPDLTVPFTDVEEIAELIKQFPEQYDLMEPFYTDGVCNTTNHLVSTLLESTKYREYLCNFWTNAFNLSKSRCGLSKLPDFTVTTARLLATSGNFDSSTISL